MVAHSAVKGDSSSGLRCACELRGSVLVADDPDHAVKKQRTKFFRYCNDKSPIPTPGVPSWPVETRPAVRRIVDAHIFSSG